MIVSRKSESSPDMPLWIGRPKNQVKIAPKCRGDRWINRLNS